MAKRTPFSTGLSLILMLAATATAASAAATLLTRRRTSQRHISHLAHKADIKSWENEGGNT